MRRSSAMRPAPRWSIATIWRCCDAPGASPARPGSSAGIWSIGRWRRGIRSARSPAGRRHRARALTWVAGALDDARSARPSGRRRRRRHPRRRRGQRARPAPASPPAMSTAPRAVLAAAQARRAALRPRLVARRARAGTVGLWLVQARKAKSWSRRARSTGRSSARPASTARATPRCSTCSAWRTAGVALLPPAGRVSLIAVDDLAALLLALGGTAAPPARSTSPTTAADGWTHAELARAIGAAVGRSGMAAPPPPPAPLARRRASTRRLRGAGAKLTPDRVGYLCHPDWTADPPADRRPLSGCPASRPPPAWPRPRHGIGRNGLL